MAAGYRAIPHSLLRVLIVMHGSKFESNSSGWELTEVVRIGI